MIQKLLNLFHSLWGGAAAGMYDKSKWIEFQRELEALQKLETDATSFFKGRLEFEASLQSMSDRAGELAATARANLTDKERELLDERVRYVDYRSAYPASLVDVETDPIRSGLRQHHVVVRSADGRVEDPASVPEAPITEHERQLASVALLVISRQRLIVRNYVMRRLAETTTNA